MSNPVPTWIKAAAAIIGLGAAAGGVYYFTLPAQKAPPVALAAPSPTPVPVPPAPTVKYPISALAAEAEAELPALPALQDGDANALADLAALLGDANVLTLIKPEFLIPRIVATVDNLPRDRLNSHALPIGRVPGDFVIAAQGDEVFIADANADRYTPYINAFVAADSAQMVTQYRRWYPLFQQAYRELGDPNAHFNDRLVEVIDHMLAAPDAVPPIALVKPKAMWQYADPSLQSASVGHRLMLRIGAAHAARVKAKLVEIRAGITQLQQ